MFSRDTSPEARAFMARRMREMTPEEKARQWSGLMGTVRDLAMAGLKSRHPEASEEELRARYAALLLDAETVRRVYGWDPKTGTPG